TEMTIEKNQLLMNELFERARDRYYSLVNRDNTEEVVKFVTNLGEALESIL
ncbi:714_t:CDS:1, partial [Ambispora gerdemannii]